MFPTEGLQEIVTSSPSSGQTSADGGTSVNLAQPSVDRPAIMAVMLTVLSAVYKCKTDKTLLHFCPEDGATILFIIFLMGNELNEMYKCFVNWSDYTLTYPTRYVMSL